jgi:murein tripeptide amidase MpaA
LASRLSAFVLVLAFGASTVRAQPARFDNHRIIRVNVTSVAQLAALEALGATILNCVHGVGPMDVLLEADQLEAVQRLGLTWQVLQNDVQGAVDRQLDSAAGAAVAGADPYADFFLSYHPYDGAGGILWFMNQLAIRYPTLVSMIDVGTTLQGRTIWGVRVSSNNVPHKPAVLYFACEHAREWVACTHPAYVAQHLAENYLLDPNITDLVDHVEFFLVPVFNVDGYVYSWTNNRFWRKNRRNNGDGTFGVDLNRNWSEGWGGQGASAVPGHDTYRGTAAFSEPETRELRDFIIAHPNIRAQLDIHNYGQLLLWPYGYTSAPSPDHAVFQEIGSAMRSLIQSVHGRDYAAGSVYTTIYPASGVSVDWTYAQRGILSFSYECRDTGLYSFVLPAAQIVPNNEELLPATLYFTDTDWVRTPLVFDFPSGLPAQIAAGAETTIAVRITPLQESPLPGTARLRYRFEPFSEFAELPLLWRGGDDYEAVLPATSCFSAPEFYFTVETLAGTVENPGQSPDPPYYTAEVMTQDGGCEAARGDHNADGLINFDDRAALAVCHAGEQAPYSTGCRAFDFDEDRDVDCDDVSAFRGVWMPPGLPPTIDPCILSAAPAVSAEGSRYIMISVPAADIPVALRIATKSFPCWRRYLDLDADPALAAARVAQIADGPVYRPAAEWGTMYLRDIGVVPGSDYHIRLHRRRQFSPGASATTFVWGDLVAPFGDVDALDVVAGVACFEVREGAPSLERCDVYPALPDHVIDALDVASIIDAFRGVAYPFALPDFCGQ